MNRMFCPIISYQRQYQSGTECMEEACALWDEEKDQCCFKTQALAAAAKPPIAPVTLQPSIQTTPAVTLNSSGDWVNPNPYRVDCEHKYNGEYETTNIAADYIFNGGL